MLVRNQDGIELLSNVCRHRQAKMLSGRGSTSNIVCPLHRWTYNLKGELIGAPHFGETPCLNLSGTPLQNYEAARQIKDSYEICAVYALLVILVVLLFDFLDKRHIPWTFLPPLAVASGKLC